MLSSGGHWLRLKWCWFKVPGLPGTVNLLKNLYGQDPGRTKTLLQIQVSTMKAKGKEIASEEEQKLLNEITTRYNSQTTPYYAAARLWVDNIIDPLETRKVIAEGINAANHNAEIRDLKLGVFQV
jgi:acetyl-CoA carboxylase carboxyltransferase component